jgi:hypothetical protein
LLSQLLLELEADQDIADEPDSLMDRVLVGLITSVRTSLRPHFRYFSNLTRL